MWKTASIWRNLHKTKGQGTGKFVRYNRFDITNLYITKFSCVTNDLLNSNDSKIYEKEPRYNKNLVIANQFWQSLGPLLYGGSTVSLLELASSTGLTILFYRTSGRMGEERGVTVIHHIVFSFSCAQSPLTVSVTVTIGARLPAEDAILEHGVQKVT